MWALFFQGATIGAIIAMPFGPVGMLCLGRAMTRGLRAGLASGSGAAAADALYGAVAAYGLTAVSDFLSAHAVWCQGLGGVFLVAMGWRLLRSAPAARPEDRAGSGHVRAFVSMFALTLANPMTLAGFAAIFAGFGLGRAEAGAGDAAAVTAGVFCGSMAWWVVIALGGKMLRRRLLDRLTAIRKVFGGLVTAFGLWALWYAATHPVGGGAPGALP